jgi:hypothetical protein
MTPPSIDQLPVYAQEVYSADVAQLFVDHHVNVYPSLVNISHANVYGEPYVTSS